MANSAEHARDLENYLRGTAMPTAPTSGWLGLLDNTDTELSYTGYVRQEIDMDEATWGPNDAPLDLQDAVPFPGPTTGGPHNQAVKGRIYKASSGSAYWFDGTLTTPRTPVNGQDFVVPAGGITHTESPAP